MALHQPFEHVEQRLLEIVQLQKHNDGMKQALDMIAVAVKDEPEAKQPNTPTAVAVVKVLERLRKHAAVVAAKAESMLSKEPAE